VRRWLGAIHSFSWPEKFFRGGADGCD